MAVASYRRSGLRAAAAAGLALMFLTAGAIGATRAAVPHVALTGSYGVTYRVTNAKNFTPTRWTYRPSKPCASPCRSVSFQQRLASEKAWRPIILVYIWNGTGYALVPRVQRGYSDCVGKGGKSVKKGYDVTSTQMFRVTEVKHGRAVRFAGTGKDAYDLNAAGRKGGCTPGAYLFKMTGVTA
jgi:hypothetical protein